MRARRRGQSTVEYLLVVAVLSIAIAAVMGTVYDTVASETAITGASLGESLTTGGIQD